MRTIAILFLMLSVAPAWADEFADKEYAKKYVGISEWHWHKAGFGSVMVADFDITNNSPWAVKDFKISCYHSGDSGTIMDQNTRVIYEMIPPGYVRHCNDVNMGFIDSQASSSVADLRDFEFVAPHLSLEQIKANLIEQNKIAATNAAAAKAAEALRKKNAEEKTVKWTQEQAAAGDAFAQLRMGERYRDGSGVEKDLAKAREMFEKSSAQGNKTAAESLKNLPSQ